MVFQALQAACSQNTDFIKQAEEKLTQWETEPGFHRTLLNIFLNISLDVNVRWMAAVYFKNGVNKYWRVNAKNEIAREEKAQIRSQLMSNFNEPVSQVAVQIAVLVGKIARFDCPREWPELLPALMEAVRTGPALQQHRSLLVLQQVIKSLSSKRMMADKKVFEEITKSIYFPVLNFWDAFTTSFFQSLQERAPPEDTLMFLEKATLSLRILKKLTIYGFYKPHNSENCMMFLESIFRRVKECLQCRYELRMSNQSDNLLSLLEKFILKQTKILNEFLEHHPLSFVLFVASALEFSFHYIFYTGTNMIFTQNNKNTFLNFCIQCINLMKNILSSTAYNADAQDMYLNESVPIAVNAKSEFFTKERLNFICEKLITQYFVLTESELDLWADDPEAYISDEGGESWKYALRPCAETFFTTLFTKFRSDMTAEVSKYIRKVQEITLTPESDLRDILLKDAIYNAAGISAFNLFDEVDFDAWFTNQLIQEASIKTDNFRIIRRRGIWLIGKWSGVKLLRDLRPKVYELCLDLLRQNENMAVRLEASKTLMATLDDFEFEPQSFLPYLEPSFSALFILLKEAKECETKMNILNTMSFVIDKMSDNISSQADNLIVYLPLLWKESTDHNMLRCAIISTLHQIVKALCEIPSNLAPFLYPVIAISTNVKESCHIYLIEEGLELWLAVLENSTVLCPELFNLSENLLPIIEISSENLRIVLNIMEAYVVLSPDVYLRRYGRNIVSTCAYLLSDLRPEGIVMILKLFETCLRADVAISLELLRPVLPRIFKEICDDKHYPMVMTMYLAVIARVLISSQAVFVEALQDVDVPNALERILDIWLLKMPLVSQTEKRKLLSLALASIITVDSPIVQMRFASILQDIAECLKDIMREDLDGVLTDALLYDEDTHTALIDDIDYKTHHSKRCRQLCMNDPVHRIVLVEYLQSQLRHIRTNVGEEKFKSLMLTIDTAILRNLSEFIDLYIEIPQTEYI